MVKSIFHNTIPNNLLVYLFSSLYIKSKTHRYWCGIFNDMCIDRYLHHYLETFDVMIVQELYNFL